MKWQLNSLESYGKYILVWLYYSILFYRLYPTTLRKFDVSWLRICILLYGQPKIGRTTLILAMGLQLTFMVWITYLNTVTKVHLFCTFVITHIKYSTRLPSKKETGYDTPSHYGLVVAIDSKPLKLFAGLCCFVVRKPSTASQIVLPKFIGDTKLLYYIHQTPLST